VSGGLWSGWLDEVTLRVPDPESALDYWARLLGGRRRDAVVALGSGTRIRVEQGRPGFAAAHLQLAAGTRDELVDPDGRHVMVTPVDVLEEPLEDAAPRLGHLTFESPDPLRAQEFWERRGFRLSEALGGFFRWLRCNPIHHTLAFSRADAPRLHHVGIELHDRAALVDACDRLSELDHQVQYGPGRHMVGRNIFVYFLDRHGIRFEFFCELERILDPERVGTVHERVERERSINLWGPQPPEAYFRGI
jgi:catechol 2,3-dioxygenase-like lactoylglutathione lyase family enzyme